MNVILHQSPCIAGCGGLAHEGRKTGDEIFIVLRIFKDRGAFNSPEDDMMQGIGCVD
jgi:hypothetical protein